MTERAQLEYPLDAHSKGALREFLKEAQPELERVQALSLSSGDVTFDVRSTNTMRVTAAAAVSISTITSGYNGQLLTLILGDSNVTFVHSASGATGTINLGGANFLSAAETVLQLVHDGTSWVRVTSVSAYDIQKASFIYAEDAGSTDAYAITLTPAPAAYTTGMLVAFKANTANTGTASLNVNGLGAKTILKHNDQTLATGDIEAGQRVLVIYDGTSFQMLSQLGQAAATPSDVQKASYIYAEDSGASDAYAVTLTPAPTAYTTGMIVAFKANTANTGAATLNVNSLGAKTIKKHNDQDLATGDIEAAQRVLVIYDGTNFQMLSQLGQAGVLASELQNQTYVYGADGGTATAYTLTLTPAPSAYAAGQRFVFKAGNTNTGNATLNVNSLGAKNIFKNLAALRPGDIQANQIIEVVYDGTQFQIMNDVAAVFPRYKMATSFEAVARYNTTFVGSGSATVGVSGLDINTGATNPSSASVLLDNPDGGLNNNLMFDGNPMFSVAGYFRFPGTSANSAQYIGVGAVTVAGSGLTYTPAHFGFKIHYSSGWKLSATVADGATENASASPVAIATNCYLELVAIDRGAAIDFYYRYNNGALTFLDSLSSNLPSGAETVALQFAVTNGSSTNQIRMTLHSASYERDYI